MILGGGGWGGVGGKVGVGVFNNLSPKVKSLFTDLKKYFYETRNWEFFSQFSLEIIYVLLLNRPPSLY